MMTPSLLYKVLCYTRIDAQRTENVVEHETCPDGGDDMEIGMSMTLSGVCQN